MTGTVLKTLTQHIAAEGKQTKSEGSVLFAAVAVRVDPGKKSPARIRFVWLLIQSAPNLKIFSYGISDAPGRVVLSAVGKKTGVLGERQAVADNSASAVQSSADHQGLRSVGSPQVRRLRLQ